MTLARRTGCPLTADDWVQAGFALLAEGGPNALRIGRLCERLEVTKGSFYWHFTDMRAYRAALAEAWGNLYDERRSRFESVRYTDPRDRLVEMMQALMRPDHWALERAMRIWALTDDAVSESVRRSDVRVLCEVRQAFVDCGFDEDEAALRSSVLFAAGVGLLHEAAGAKDAPAAVRERVLDLMLRR
jgi:AcrR family transcriptional regulator